jgi:hypothetical protein
MGKSCDGLSGRVIPRVFVLRPRPFAPTERRVYIATAVATIGRRVRPEPNKLRLSLFFHHADDVAIGIADEGHPEFMVGHFSYQGGAALVGGAAGEKSRVRRRDV